MRVLVTGGAGFIGSHVVESFVRNTGFEVVVLDDLSTGRLSNLEGLDVDVVEADVTDASIVRRLSADVEAIVHLAALGSVPLSVEEPLRSQSVNVDGTLTVLEAARARRTHVVFASSSAVYGTTDALVNRTTDAPFPMTPYAASKLAAESMLLAYQASYGLPALAFRFFNVYGPRQDAHHPYAAVIPRFIDAALRQAPLHIHGDGEQTRDFTHVRTVARVLVESVVSGVRAPGAVNLAFGTSTSVNALVQSLDTLLTAPVDVVYETPRTGDVRHSRADATQMGALFPHIHDVDFDSGLAETLAWYRSAADQSAAQTLS